MDERITAQLQLVKGKCAGKEGECPNENLVWEGYCADCAVDHLDTLITSVQNHFDGLVERHQDLAKRDERDHFVTDPFIGFVKEVAGIRKDAVSGQFGGLTRRAQKIILDMDGWESFQLIRRANQMSQTVGQSSPIGMRLAVEANSLHNEKKFVTAIEKAREAITILGPLEEVRLKLVKRMEERRRERRQANQTPGVDASSSSPDSEAQSA